MIKSKKQMFTVIVAFVLVMLLGTVTYAFFNYTRTGAANTISTGRIAFNAEYGDTVTLSDLFPISTSGTITSTTPGVGSVVIHVTGDTNYSGGLEYLVKAVNVSNTSGSTALPISIEISYEETQGETIGTEDNAYFANRGGNTSLYKVLSTDTITNNGNLVVGYIAPSATGIDGNIVIMAYLDANNIAITDTYPEGIVYGLNDDMDATEEAACETILDTGYTSPETAADFCAGTGTRGGKTFQEHLDENLFTAEEIEDLEEANVILELYTDGTTSTWVHERTVLTTEEWNALSTNGVSFQVRVEANEGIWVPGTITGSATITPDTLTSADFTVIQGGIKYETSINVNNNQLEFGTPAATVSKYNSATTSYVDVTDNNDIDEIVVSLQHNDCNNGNAVTVTNHASGNYVDGMEMLDPTFVQCLITANQP